MPNSNCAAIVPDVTVSFALLYPGIEKLDLGDGWLPTWRTPSCDHSGDILFHAQGSAVDRQNPGRSYDGLSSPSVCDSSIRQPGANFENPRVLLLPRS
jgi:hypothetical protein